MFIISRGGWAGICLAEMVGRGTFGNGSGAEVTNCSSRVGRAIWWDMFLKQHKQKHGRTLSSDLSFKWTAVKTWLKLNKHYIKAITRFHVLNQVYIFYINTLHLTALDTVAMTASSSLETSFLASFEWPIT